MSYKDYVKRTSVTLMMVTVNLMFGVIALPAIGVFVGPLMDPNGGTANILRWIALALPVLEAPVAFLIYTGQGRRMAGFENWETRLALFRARAIFTTGLIEAPALFAGVVVILAGFTWHVIPAIAMFFIVVALIFPTTGNIKRAIGTEDAPPAGTYS